jgi:aerobic carbon-monoxide dehydrogenase large subunit
MPGSILGNAVRRVEDPELLLGRGTYVGNLRVDGMLHVAFVRSPIAHARVTSVDTAAAEAMPGVVAVFIAANLGLPRMHGFMVVNEACGRPPLADDKVRFVGECVAAVVAESKTAAVDAAEVVEVDYDPLPAVVDPEAALAADAPLQFEELGTNIAGGVRDAGPDPLADAEVLVRGRFENQRVAVAPMEGNAIAVVPPDAADGVLTIYVSTQMPHVLADNVAEVFGIATDELRVVAPHVGGAFGGKAGLAVEHAVVIAAARQLGHPASWIETRSENLVGMPHSRAQVQWVELGLRRDGSISGLRCRVLGDSGAYAGFGGMFAYTATYIMAEGVYRIPKLGYDGAAVMTNTSPTGGVRGAGRPEATAMLERMMDLAAAELEMDPLELRRRKFLRPDEFPYDTHTGMRYDSGDYDAALTEAARIAGYDELREEQAERRRRGDARELGIGVSVYVEITAAWADEFAAVEVHDDATATIRAGTSAHGQGHATSFAMIVADNLGIPVEHIRFVAGDTASVPSGRGTGGSRSLQIGGSAVLGATTAVLDRARQLAADRLEADVEDIVVHSGGRVGVAGAPAKALTWGELSAAAANEGEPLSADFNFVQPGMTYPFGAHLAVVEVDTATGAVDLLRHIAVDDCGRIVNPLIVAGQQHGGIAHGVAQALWEHVVYDDDGNPLTSTLLDYAVPSAAELPSFEAANTETPTPLNPLGAKGIGESATIGSTPAVQNAVIDALRHLGVRHIDMPCTPERVWTAIEAARSGTLPSPWREPPAAFDTLPARGFGAPATVGAEL